VPEKSGGRGLKVRGQSFETAIEGRDINLWSEKSAEGAKKNLKKWKGAPEIGDAVLVRKERGEKS